MIACLSDHRRRIRACQNDDLTVILFASNVFCAILRSEREIEGL